VRLPTTFVLFVACAALHPALTMAGVHYRLWREGWCRHFRVEAYLKAHPDANSEVTDVEDLVAQGRAGGPCPYYLTREMAAGADLVLMPYNYLVDARTRFGLKSIQWRGSVLIFDEAHNVEVRGGRTVASHVLRQESTSERGHTSINTLGLALFRS